MKLTPPTLEICPHVGEINCFEKGTLLELKKQMTSMPL
jgi:hypothetical protein